MSQALSWSMFRVKLVRDLNPEKGLWGWAVITKYCYCTEATLADTGRQQGRTWPISCSFHRLTPFFLPPISGAPWEPARRGQGNAVSLAGHRAERGSKWMGSGMINLVLFLSYIQALKIHLVIWTWLASEIWLAESRKNGYSLSAESTEVMFLLQLLR